VCTGPLSRRLLAEEREPEQHAAVYHNIEEAVSKHVGADGITLVAAIWLVSSEA